MNTIGTLQAYITTHQLAAYSESTNSWIFSIYIFLSFFCGLQIGPIFDAKGPRLLVIVGSVLLVGSTFALAESTQYWHFILSFSICGGLGTALIFTPAVSAIAHFFSKNRGTAIGIAATGGSIGGIVLPLMLQRLFEDKGWQWAIRAMGFMFIFLLIVANCLIKSRLPPKVGGSIWPDMLIFRQVDFAITTAGVFCMEWGLFVPVTFLTSWALSLGIGDQLGSGERSAFGFQLIAILNAASSFGRWGPGFAADKIGRFNIMTIMMALCAISCMTFWLPPTVLASSPSFMASSSPKALAISFAILFGFASGSNISLTPVCVGQLCDTLEYGRYYASCYTVVSIGTLTGLPIVGAILQMQNGTYGGAIAFTVACYTVGTTCFAIVRVRRAGWGIRGIC